ncbi:Coiled-coil domain-containing protein 43-like protein [Bienertia sinuspersici]
MYGYAEAILALYKFEEEDIAEFGDLALCILLNSTAILVNKRSMYKLVNSVLLS